MCLKPRVIVNRHYLKISKSLDMAESLFGSAPDFYIKVDCGNCIECQRKRANGWRTRLLDEYNYHIKYFPKGSVSFCTLTVSPQYYSEFVKDPGVFVRRFLERYRKRYGVSFKHFITSEYGEKRGRLHLHMIGFRMLCDIRELRDLWHYGRVDIQTLKGPQGITYVSGYITKVVKGDHLSGQLQPYFIDPDKKTKVWVSPALGLSYCMDNDKRQWHTSGRSLRFVRVRDNGSPYALPRYYLDKLFSPIDLARRRLDFIRQSFELPKPPYRVHKSFYGSLDSYFSALHKIGGSPVLLSPQFDLLTYSQIQNYYGK